MKKKLIVLSGLVMGWAPLVALASTPVQATCGTVGGAGSGITGNSTIESVICRVGSILNTIIPFLIVLGVVYFVWGVATYVIAADEEAKSSGRNKMIFGIIGLAVIVGVWGLVTILTNTFGLNTVAPIVTPCIVGTPGC